MADSKELLQGYLNVILDKENQEKLRRLLHEVFYMKEDERMLLARPDSDDFKEYPIIVIQGKSASGKTTLKNIIVDAIARITPSNLTMHFLETAINEKGEYNNWYVIHDKKYIRDLFITSRCDVESTVVKANTVLLLDSSFSITKTFVNAQIINLEGVTYLSEVSIYKLSQPFLDWIKSYEAPMTKGI